MSTKNFLEYNLSGEILKAIEELGYIVPTEVQEKAIPLVLDGVDAIVKSQTGSGKTAAFGIPLCEKLELEQNRPQALVLTPTRELCVQIKEDLSNIGRLKRLRCAAVFGKQPFDMQVKELKQRVHMIVGTPGRTLDHIERGTIDLQDIKYLVIDEADEMLNMGFIEQVEAVISSLPKNRVTLLFSATMPVEIEKICTKYMKEPVKVDINVNSITVDKVEDFYYEVPEKEKFSLLNKLILTMQPESSIIFCNTREKVDYVVSRLKAEKYPCASLHGGMLQNERLDTIKGFKRGEFMFLVATDVAARGIDVSNIEQVINYDLPMEKESYVHRIGRTGRAGKSGKAISFVTPFEDKFLEGIEEYIGRSLSEGQDLSSVDFVKAKSEFSEKLKVKPKLKSDKAQKLNKNITKIYINAGKKKKIRTIDIVGTISNIEGISSSNIGIIDIQDNFTYIDILDGKGNLVIEAMKNKTIKGKKVRCEKADK